MMTYRVYLSPDKKSWTLDENRYGAMASRLIIMEGGNPVYMKDGTIAVVTEKTNIYHFSVVLSRWKYYLKGNGKYGKIVKNQDQLNNIINHQIPSL